MPERRRDIWRAVITGFVASAILACISLATGSDSLLPPQFAGAWLTMVMRGVESATNVDFMLIAMPVNAAIYAVIVYAGLRVYRRVVSK